MPTLVLINGASGAGKTTAASLIHGFVDGSTWIHPDGLWPETPSMTSEQIFGAALDRLRPEHSIGLIIIDCQIKSSDARRIALRHPTIHLTNVLLTCSRLERERRLRERSDYPHELDRIETWNQVLVNDAERAGDMIIDATSQPSQAVAHQILGAIAL